MNPRLENRRTLPRQAGTSKAGEEEFFFAKKSQKTFAPWSAH
jgi:hypothetical protein